MYRTRRLTLVTAMAAAVLATTPAVAANASSQPSPSYATAPCPKPNIPEIGPAADLGPEFTCGFLTVPEDRSRPDGRMIRVAVAHAKAASATPKPDPIVFLTHGPGGVAFLDAVREVGAGMNADRDVYFVAQRGNYHSDPQLTCPDYDAFADGTALGLKFAAPSTGVQNLAAVKACRDKLAATGAHLASYNTVENAADIADLRRALGIEQWNVYSVSYGTNVAQILLRDHPEGIRSMVLDSVSPINQNLFTEGWPAAAGMYQAIFDACAKQPACAAAYPRLKEEFTEAVNRLNQTPLVVSTKDAAGRPVEVNIDGYTLAWLVTGQSYTGPTGFATIPSMIHTAANGDGREAAAARLARVAPFGLAGYGLAFGAYCREMASWTDPEQVAAAGKAVLPGFPDEVLRLVMVPGRMSAECAAWDVGSATPAERTPVVSDVPALLMGGAMDGVTPARWADVAAKGLRNSETIAIPGTGHDVIAQSPCARSMMNAFFDDPTRPVDRACLSEITIPPFKTP
ncbi:alpha/beta hydrolase [Catellatospora chokoriensis]|uniref:Alpha/beta hydrolase n=1 Tax=Catellatospora chokoriensis TaxID=310353 RepID=A0A8J3JY51_9ACTN|nr:alpha/beta hydrolase [Catellatospora chokoriensis]GIF93272.1 alpha/beta hydrolase [Catellatospora chokoriensis]